MQDHLKNNSDDVLVAFGLLTLPNKFKTEYDAILTITGIMAFAGVLANAILLLVIIRDPNKQLRTITAILVAFNGVTNLIVSLWYSLERILAWSGHPDIFTPELTVYLGVCNFNMYVLGSLLLNFNCYGSIVAPLRYKRLAPQQPRKIIVFLSMVSLVNVCVFMVIPYTLPSSKVVKYIEVILTMEQVIFAGSTAIFIALYVGIFRSLHRRRGRLDSFHIRRSTQGLRVFKQNDEVAKTLFIHITYLVFASLPGSITFLLALHCSRCKSTNVQLLALFVYPLAYSLFLFHPILWLCRMNNYRRALIQISRCRTTARSQNTCHPSFQIHSRTSNYITRTV